MDAKVFEIAVSAFTRQIGLSKSPIVFTKRLKTRFAKTARQSDERFPKDSYVEFAADHIHVRRRKAPPTPEVMKRFDAAIRDAMPPFNILDLLVETSQWVNLHKSFKPVSGHQTKIDEYLKRLVVTLFCYGCNLGPVQTARSVKGFSRKQIAYLNLAHTREKDLIEATRLVANLVIRQLRKEGYEITDDMLAGIAPYRRNHIDLLGKYPLRVNRRRSRQSLKLH